MGCSPSQPTPSPVLSLPHTLSSSGPGERFQDGGRKGGWDNALGLTFCLPCPLGSSRKEARPTLLARAPANCPSESSVWSPALLGCDGWLVPRLSSLIGQGPCHCSTLCGDPPTFPESGSWEQCVLLSCSVMAVVPGALGWALSLSTRFGASVLKTQLSWGEDNCSRIAPLFRPGSFLPCSSPRVTLVAPWCVEASFRAWCPGGPWGLVARKACQESTPISASMWTGSWRSSGTTDWLRLPPPFLGLGATRTLGAPTPSPSSTPDLTFLGLGTLQLQPPPPKPHGVQRGGPVGPFGINTTRQGVVSVCLSGLPVLLENGGRAHSFPSSLA